MSATELNGNHGAEVKAQNQASDSASGYNQGPPISRFITPGGNPMDTSQPAFPVFHRKFANPAPLGLLA